MKEFKEIIVDNYLRLFDQKQMKQNPKLKRIQFGVIDMKKNQELKGLIKRKNSEILLYVKSKEVYKEIH